jgi:serine/threonine protein kinase/CHAT domain-containing protein/tetratricopeptide (TPR) repeat protein
VTPERLRDVERLFHEAREQPPADRDAWVARACADDPALRREVASLLAQPPVGVIDSPVAALAATLLSPSAPRLAPGSSVGPYRIERLIDVGGMGEVYRARDTRLDRPVAIKILPADVVTNPQRRARFRREARAISSLTHPHICTLYDVGEQDGSDFLVMEYLEGETLAHRLLRGALPIEEVLRIAIQLADALNAAQRVGLIHRDLKPANVMLTASGAKVLDFGLAKWHGTEPDWEIAAAEAMAPSTMTQSGRVMGTVQYMAPEQAAGKPTDARSDLFALGAIIYEMATGRKAFENTSQALTPPAFDRAVRKCLATDPVGRWQTAADFKDELAWIEGDLDGRLARASAESSRTPSLRRVAWTLVAASATLAMVVFISWSRKPPYDPAAEMRQFAEESTATMRRGELPAAQSLAERGLALAQSQRSSLWEWTFRLLRAESLVLQSTPTEAVTDLTDPLPATGDFDSLRARQQLLYAKTQVAERHIQEALNTVEHGRRMASSHDVHFDLDEFAAQLHLRLGQIAEGEALLHTLVVDASDVGDRYHQAMALNDIGMGRLVSHRYQEALSWFERVLSLTDLEPLTIYRASLANAAGCYIHLGDFDRAAALQRRALRIQEQHPPSRGLIAMTGDLGTTFLLKGDAVQGVPYMRRALAMAKDLHENVDAARWAGNLAEAYIELGQWDEAAAFSDDETLLWKARGSGRPMSNILLAARIAEGRGRNGEARELFENAMATSSGEPSIQWYANARLARLAIVSHDDEHAGKYFERALQLIEQTTFGSPKSEPGFFQSGLMQFYRDYVDALIAQGRVERALEVADSGRRRLLAQRQPPGGTSAGGDVASFRHVAERSGQVMLFYWLQPKASWLWVVTPKDIHLLPLPAGDQIEALVRQHQQAIGSALNDPLAFTTTAGDRLYTALLAPATRWLPSGGSVIIVEDDLLHGLNFETLPVAGPKRHYWIEDVTLQIVPSLGFLAAGSNRAAARRSPVPPTPSLLLIGSPTVSDPTFPALSYASAEMSKIAHHFAPDHVVSYEGARASPTAYRDARPDRFSLIHFTAHAAANVESPLDAAVVLAVQDGSYRLYARDVANQPIHASVVTVSACRCAGERTNAGEGLVGFAWTFLRAGAQRVIAGLWEVDDQSTASLMDSFYAGLVRGEPPPRALRNAKLARLRAGGPLAKPYYWGSFELVTVTP